MWYDFETRYQWIREHHAALLREAEIERERARPAFGSSLRSNVAAFLRGLANRLDPEAARSEPFPFSDWLLDFNDPIAG
ncbi:MAG TPA: hypothetical protein VFZ25_12795 [Chloroflexota bacterium]|nr:hypothetical protein [Chloroflexota bacterium]